MEYTNFVEVFCRWIPVPGTSPAGEEQLSLKEKSNFDCIFWEQGCKVYEKRPLQCRSYPFWDSIMSSPHAWKTLDCPGKNRGILHTGEQIGAFLKQRREEPVVTRGGT